MVGGAPYCCELLLQDHATIGMRGSHRTDLTNHLICCGALLLCIYFIHIFVLKKNTLALRVLVVMVTGMTDENGWQEIHQVTHTQTHNQENYLH